MIRPVSLSDAPAIASIYNHYIRHTSITFEEETLADAVIAARIRDVTASFPWLVWEDQSGIRGYAYAGKWRDRSAFRHCVESAIYLHPDASGRGIGTALYRRLLEELRQRGLHTVVAGISLPNPASQRLHEKLGFEKVAHFSQVGWKFNQWIDVAFWQASLERSITLRPASSAGAGPETPRR